MTDQLAVETGLDAEALAAFEETVRGNVLTPGDPGYDEARSIWNALIDRRRRIGLRGRSRPRREVEKKSREHEERATQHDFHSLIEGTVTQDGESSNKADQANGSEEPHIHRRRADRALIPPVRRPERRTMLRCGSKPRLLHCVLQ